MKSDKSMLVNLAAAFFLAALATPASSIVTNIFASAGVFNNTILNQALLGTLNNTTFASTYHGTGAQPSTNFAAAGVAGLTTSPSGSTNTDTMGLFGGALCGNNTTNCEGGTFYALANANGSGSTTADRVRVWGVNPVIIDSGFTHVLLQNEFDVNVSGTDTQAFGISIVGASTHALAAGSAGISLGAPGSGINWPYGIIVNDGSVGVNDGIRMGLQTAGSTNQASQLERFVTTDSGGSVHTAAILGFSAGGYLIAADTENTNSAAQVFFDFGGANKATMNHDGSLSQVGVTFSNLPTTNGTIVYCTNCTIANPCASGGSGAFAKRLNGVSVCN
jgi:hypothetical protein